MSRSISESLSLLSETLGNCKTNLKEKSVENVDNIKISDVDEKIAEIKSGGGSEIDCPVTINKVTWNNSENVTNSRYIEGSGTNNKLTFDITTSPNGSSGYNGYLSLSQTYNGNNLITHIKENRCNTGQQNIEFTNINAPYDTSNNLKLFWNTKSIENDSNPNVAEFKIKLLWSSFSTHSSEG